MSLRPPLAVRWADAEMRRVRLRLPAKRDTYAFGSRLNEARAPAKQNRYASTQSEARFLRPAGADRASPRPRVYGLPQSPSQYPQRLSQHSPPTATTYTAWPCGVAAPVTGRIAYVWIAAF